MLNTAKASTPALLNAAKRCLDARKYPEAEQYLHAVLQRGEESSEVIGMTAQAYAGQGKTWEAASFYMAALRAHPAEFSFKVKIVSLGGARAVDRYHELVDFAVLECLKDADRLDCSGLQTLWLTNLLYRPDFDRAYGLAHKTAGAPENAKFFDALADFKPLLTPYFLLGIKNIVVCNLVFEEFITHIRKQLLFDVDVHRKFTQEELTVLAAAVSHYAFNTDYILNVSEEEQARIDALRQEIEISADLNLAQICIYACYAPLCGLNNEDRVVEKFGDDPLAHDIIQKQIHDPAQLQEITKNITALTSISDAVSAKVQEQYEAFPYPRWKQFPIEEMLYSRKLHANPFSAEKHLHDKKIKILIAGAGTGYQSVGFSLLFPKAEILAVDLSRASLAYATQKANEYGLKNIIFRQADILQLDTLGEKFDYIASTGVLHHLEDPVTGWRILRDLLKPDGVMKIALYSKLARSAIIAVQDIIKNSLYTPDAQGMRDFRAKSAQVLPPELLYNVAGFADYYYLNAYRDLLFHVQEYNYTLPEIAEILQALGLKFAGFYADPAVLDNYARHYPLDSKKTSLENWHAFEQKNPATFAGMYNFWCVKA